MEVMRAKLVGMKKKPLNESERRRRDNSKKSERAMEAARFFYRERRERDESEVYFVRED